MRREEGEAQQISEENLEREIDELLTEFGKKVRQMKIMERNLD